MLALTLQPRKHPIDGPSFSPRRLRPCLQLQAPRPARSPLPAPPSRLPPRCLSSASSASCSAERRAPRRTARRSSAAHLLSAVSHVTHRAQPRPYPPLRESEFNPCTTRPYPPFATRSTTPRTTAHSKPGRSSPSSVRWTSFSKWCVPRERPSSTMTSPDSRRAHRRRAPNTGRWRAGRACAGRRRRLRRA